MTNWCVVTSIIQRQPLPPNTGPYGHYTEETIGRNGNLTLPTRRMQVLKYGPGVTYLRLKILQSMRGFGQVSN